MGECGLAPDQVNLESGSMMLVEVEEDVVDLVAEPAHQVYLATADWLIEIGPVGFRPLKPSLY